MNKKLIIIAAVFIVVVSVGVGLYAMALPGGSYFIQNDGYSKITIVEGQGKVATFGGYEYAFTYDHDVPVYGNGKNGAVSYFYVATGISLVGTPFVASVGINYNYSGITMRISELHDSYCVLSVKSTVS